MNVSIKRDMQNFVEQKVASGDYASSSEVIRDGLRAMQERDAAVEKWLRNEVLPTYDRFRAHPETAIPLDEAFDRIEDELRSRIPVTGK